MGISPNRGDFSHSTIRGAVAAGLGAQRNAYGLTMQTAHPCQAYMPVCLPRLCAWQLSPLLQDAGLGHFDNTQVTVNNQARVSMRLGCGLLPVACCTATATEVVMMPPSLV